MLSRRIGMIRISLTLSILAFGVVVSIPALAAREEPSNERAATALVQVETKYVCMINDQRFSKVQIPVEVEGRTYYGCCPMCKDRLTKQPESRTAQDPVTGEQVDKARAVMVQVPTGKILYFASEATLQRYRG